VDLVDEDDVAAVELYGLAWAITSSPLDADRTALKKDAGQGEMGTASIPASLPDPGGPQKIRNQPAGSMSSVRPAGPAVFLP